MKTLIVQKLFKSTGIKQSFLTITGNSLSTGISAIAVILIVRLLGPEKYGEFSVGFAIAQILVRLNDWGLNTAILKYASSSSDQTEQNSIYSLTLKYKLLFSLLIFLIGLVSYRYVTSLLNLTNPLIILAAFSLGLATVYYEQLLSMLQSVHAFFNTVKINTIQAIVKLGGIGILLALSVHQTLPLFLWYIVAPLASVFFSRWLLPSWVEINLTVKNPILTRKIWALAWHSSIALISAGIIENIDILFLQKNLSTYETGLYGGVSRIAMIFALIAYSLGNVLNPRVARYKTKEHLRPYIKKSLLLAGATLLGFIAFVPFAKPLILFTIGPEYLSGLPILLMLTAASFLAIASIPFMALFYSFNANWYFSVSGILQLIIVLAGNFIFVPLYGLEAAAWTRLAARVFLLLFTFLLGMYVYLKNYEKRLA